MDRLRRAIYRQMATKKSMAGLTTSQAQSLLIADGKTATRGNASVAPDKA
jgi:hypothetical protein